MAANFQWMVDIVAANGNPMTYEAFMASVPPENRRSTVPGFKVLKSTNALRKRIRVVDGQPVHEVYIPEA